MKTVLPSEFEKYNRIGRFEMNTKKRRKVFRKMIKMSLLRILKCRDPRNERRRRVRGCKNVRKSLLQLTLPCVKMKDKVEDPRITLKGVEEMIPRWNCLPNEILLKIFQFLSAEYLVKASQVCQMWNSVGQDPWLWRNIEIKVGANRDAMSEDLIQFILNHHSKHLKSVTFTADSSKESAEKVCHILKKLVHCSLRTLAFISCTGPVFLDINHELFTSALTGIIDRKDTIRNLAVDYTLIDDPSLKRLAKNHSESLQFLKMKSCPLVSPDGVLTLADHCHRLKELSLNYALLSDDILLSLSSEQHVRLTHLRIDVFTDETTKPKNKISSRSWQALIDHSPNINLIMYFFAVDDETYDLFFNSYNPVSHVYFCEYVPKTVLQRISRNCPRVRELVVNGSDGPSIDCELIDIGLHCDKLTSIGLYDCIVSCSAFVEFVRICSKRLSELFISEDCLSPTIDCDLQNVILTVSELLSMDWEPEFTPLW